MEEARGLTRCSAPPQLPKTPSLTHKPAAQPRLGHGAEIRVTPQEQLLVQIQTLELPLRAQVGGHPLQHPDPHPKCTNPPPQNTWEVPLTGGCPSSASDPRVRLRSSRTVWNSPRRSGVGCRMVAMPEPASNLGVF